jgi:hypothetical protein
MSTKHQKQELLKSWIQDMDEHGLDDLILEFVDQEPLPTAKLTMRKVKFRLFIKPIYSDEIRRIAVPGTRCWEEGFPHEGIFHQWAATYEEGTEGFGNYTVALVELPDGTVESVLPCNIQFINE